MDLVLSWIFFGVAMGVAADFLGVSPQRQNFIISLLLGVMGAAAGGSLGLFSPLETISESMHVSPLVFVLVGSFLLVVVPKSYKKVNSLFPERGKLEESENERSES